MDGQLKVVITADNKAAIAALNNTDRALNKTADIATRTGSAIAKSSNTAGNALTNLSRIAQDAPFGFIGIQNNLNPMLESFQRLKVESGSTGAALKQMAAGLIGPAGIGVALSVASALFITFGDRLFNAKKNADDAANSLQQYTKVIAEANKEAGKEITDAKLLYEASRNVALSMQDRLRAATQLKELYPKLLGEYSAEDIALGKAKEGYDKLTQSILQTSRAKAAAAKISELEAKKLDAEFQKRKVNAFVDKEIRDATAQYFGGAGGGATVSRESVIAAAEGRRATALKQQDDIIKQIVAQQMFYEKMVGSTALQESVITKEKQKQLTTTKQINEQAPKEKIQSYKPVGGRLGLTATPERDLEIEQQQVGVSKTYNQLFADRLVMQDSMNEKIALANNLTEMSMGIFEGLGQAMLMGQDLGEALGNTFKRLAVQIAAAALKALVFKSILGAITGGASTGVDAATGGGFSSLFGSIFGGRAIGGVTQGPKSGYPMMLHGTEAVLTPHQMTGIINQSMNAGAMQGMSMNNQMGGGSFVLRGNDLVLALQRSNYALNLRRG